jgi:hypothetical protein
VVAWKQKPDEIVTLLFLRKEKPLMLTEADIGLQPQQKPDGLSPPTQWHNYFLVLKFSLCTSHREGLVPGAGMSP